jgi:hypothetical protein
MARALITGLLLAAALAVLAGGLTVDWWSYESDGMSVTTGLRESRFCSPEGCQTAWLGEGSDHERWVRAGMATYAAAFLAAGLLLLVAATVVLRRARELLIKTSLVAAFSAALSGLIFVWLAPEQYRDMNTGYSMICFFLGTPLGFGAAFAALRQTSGAGAVLARARESA